MPIEAPELKVTDDLRTFADREETVLIDVTEAHGERTASAPPEVWLG